MVPWLARECALKSLLGHLKSVCQLSTTCETANSTGVIWLARLSVRQRSH